MCRYRTSPNVCMHPWVSSDDGVCAFLTHTPQCSKQLQWCTDDGVCATTAPTRKPASILEWATTMGSLPFSLSHHSVARNRNGAAVMEFATSSQQLESR
jgi:hypothetical protein